MNISTLAPVALAKAVVAAPQTSAAPQQEAAAAGCQDLVSIGEPGSQLGDRLFGGGSP
jgi:hypothetical protein